MIWKRATTPDNVYPDRLSPVTITPSSPTGSSGISSDSTSASSVDPFAEQPGLYASIREAAQSLRAEVVAAQSSGAETTAAAPSIHPVQKIRLKFEQFEALLDDPAFKGLRLEYERGHMSLSIVMPFILQNFLTGAMDAILRAPDSKPGLAGVSELLYGTLSTNWMAIAASNDTDRGTCIATDLSIHSYLQGAHADKPRIVMEVAASQSRPNVIRKLRKILREADSPRPKVGFVVDITPKTKLGQDPMKPPHAQLLIFRAENDPSAQDDIYKNDDLTIFPRSAVTQKSFDLHIGEFFGGRKLIERAICMAELLEQELRTGSVAPSDAVEAALLLVGSTKLRVLRNMVINGETVSLDVEVLTKAFERALALQVRANRSNRKRNAQSEDDEEEELLVPRTIKRLA